MLDLERRHPQFDWPTHGRSGEYAGGGGGYFDSQLAPELVDESAGVGLLLGIAAIKRIQSLFQGTLVAQDVFSVYDRSVLLEVGGWPHTVGEDIVLNWKILRAK